MVLDLKSVSKYALKAWKRIDLVPEGNNPRRGFNLNVQINQRGLSHQREQSNKKPVVPTRVLNNWDSIYTPNTTTANTMMRVNTPRFNMTYSKHEAPILIPIEYELMKQLGIDRSSLHKTAIKEFYNRRQQSTLNLIWGRYGKDHQDLRCLLPDAYRCRQTLEDETRWLGGGTGSGGVLKQEQEEIKGARNSRVSRTSRGNLIPEQ